MIRYNNILREEYGFGDRMFGEDGSDKELDEMERFLSPGIFFVFFPVFFSLLGILTLTQLPWLIGQYNYLRGAPSPIDQSTLALLGSDLSGLVILASSIIGMMIGLFLSRFVTTKLDVVRKEGEVILSARMHVVLLSWWWFLIWPFQMICILEFIAYGPPTSHFLIDLGFSLTAGYWLAFAIPVLLKYLLLVLHAKSNDSRVKWVEFRRGSGFIKRLQYVVLKVVPDDGFEWW